jgi:hypothetical protein
MSVDSLLSPFAIPNLFFCQQDTGKEDTIMPTADRTTVRAAMDEFVSKLGLNLAAEPPTVTKPFRKVAVSLGTSEEYARPFLTVRVARVEPVAAVDDDRIFEVSLKLRMVTDVTAADPHGSIFDKIGAIEDYLDGIRDTGVIVGAEGFDRRAWTIEYPRPASAARTATAEATEVIVVKVQRGQNRVGAT